MFYFWIASHLLIRISKSYVRFRRFILAALKLMRTHTCQWYGCLRLISPRFTAKDITQFVEVALMWHTARIKSIFLFGVADCSRTVQRIYIKSVIPQPNRTKFKVELKNKKSFGFTCNLISIFSRLHIAEFLSLSQARIHKHKHKIASIHHNAERYFGASIDRALLFFILIYIEKLAHAHFHIEQASKNNPIRVSNIPNGKKSKNMYINKPQKGRKNSAHTHIVVEKRGEHPFNIVPTAKERMFCQEIYEHKIHTCTRHELSL